MTGHKMVVIGACVAGLLLGEITTIALPRDAAAAPRTETATFALG